MKTLASTCSKPSGRSQRKPAAADKPARFSALIPFGGFYESRHDARIDDVEERMFHDDQGVIAHESLYSCFWSGVDYSKVFQEYAKCYVQILARETGIAMDYEELVSPLWYNFETDRIFAKITRQDLARMLKAVRGLRLKQLACETFTSRPGFASNYSSDIRHWGRIATWDHNQIGTVLAAYIDKLNMDGSLADEVGLAEEHITDESIETWLIEAASPAAQRALKVSDYLRRRSERAHRSAPVQPAQA